MSDQFFADAGFQTIGCPHDEGDFQAFLIQKLFATRVADAVISQKEDNSVVKELVLLKAGEDAANLHVCVLHGVQVFSPVFANDRMVGVIRRESDICGADQILLLQTRDSFFIPLIDVAELSAAQLELGEERLSLLTPRPIYTVVEIGPLINKVVVFLPGPCSIRARVGRVIAGFTKEFGNGPHPCR